jgi:cytochrome c peroxidase
VARNAPDLLNAAWYSRSHFWDGKVENLWSAPLFTFEQEDEMGATRLGVVRTLTSIYGQRYQTVFGALPDFSDTSRFPLSGKPGDPQYDAMAALDKDLVNQVYANVGKALEAYLRKLAAGRSPFDDFIRGSPTSLGAQAQRGMLAFSRQGCGNCHAGPGFSDEDFHNLGYPGAAGRPKDPARAGGAAYAGKSVFTSTGQFADPTRSGTPTAASGPAGDPEGFRTPSLRNLALSAPYGHDGAFDTLEQVIDAHARVLAGKAPLDAQDKTDIIVFLRSLDGGPPRPPWNYWPGG